MVEVGLGCDNRVNNLDAANQQRVLTPLRTEKVGGLNDPLDSYCLLQKALQTKVIRLGDHHVHEHGKSLYVERGLFKIHPFVQKHNLQKLYKTRLGYYDVTARLI